MNLKDYKEGVLTIFWQKIIRKLIGPLLIVTPDEYEEAEPDHLMRFNLASNYYIDMYCHKCFYMVRFTRFFLRDKHYVMFKFTSVCSPQLDGRIVEALKEPVYFPNIKISLLNEKQHMTIFINAYLETIVSRLKNPAPKIVL